MKRILFSSLATSALAAAAFAAPDGRTGVLERKDAKAKKASGADMGDAEFKDEVLGFMQDFSEFQKKNDERLAEIEKKGSADVITEEEVDRINESLDKFEGLSGELSTKADVEAEMKKIDERFDHIETMLNRKSTSGDDELEIKKRLDTWCRAAFNAIQRGHTGDLNDEQKSALEDSVQEYKALNVSTNTEGGYLAPVEMVREIIKELTEISPVRSLARVRTTSQRSIELPKRTARLQGGWAGAETSTKSNQGEPAYGVWEIPTHELYALIDITNWMLEDSVFNIEDEVEMESIETFAELEGAAFVNGTGVGQPLGFLDTSSGLGQVVSGTAATIADANGQANGLIDLKYALKTGYAAGARWLLNRNTMGEVRKLKDGQNNYIWMPGIAQGRPNTIDGDPYTEMPDMPNQGAGAFPIAYGNWRRCYTWVDRLQMEMLRDPYTQATGGKIRYIMRKRVAGRVTLAEAGKILKCATS